MAYCMINNINDTIKGIFIRMPFFKSHFFQLFLCPLVCVYSNNINCWQVQDTIATEHAKALINSKSGLPACNEPTTHFLC